MTNAELLAYVQEPEFDIEAYAPSELDSPSEAQAKMDFLTQLASLPEDEELTLPEPISCMVNCVIIYLECCGGNGPNPSCWLMLQTCIGNCQQ